MVYYVISDSGGDATTLFVNDPDFAILKVAAQVTAARFQTKCPRCTLKMLDVATSDLATGNVAAGIVSRQSDPKIQYVDVAIGDLSAGLPAALDAAGLSGKIKIVGTVPNKEQVQSLIDKKTDAYIPLGRPESAWAGGGRDGAAVGRHESGPQRAQPTSDLAVDAAERPVARSVVAGFEGLPVPVQEALKVS